MNLNLSRQPAKGLVFTLASVPVAFGLWFLLIKIFGLTYSAGTLVFTVCFTYFWQHGWSFQGWPSHLWTKSRWIQGVVNWVLLMLTVWLTILIWATITGKPFFETQLGLWAQTTIIAAVISLFFFGNRTSCSRPVWPIRPSPLQDSTNLVWAVLFVPTALLFLPGIWGAPSAYIPWIWFPVALIPLAYFGGWPFDRLGQPRAGIAYAGVTFFPNFRNAGPP